MIGDIEESPDGPRIVESEQKSGFGTVRCMSQIISGPKSQRQQSIWDRDERSRMERVKLDQAIAHLTPSQMIRYRQLDDFTQALCDAGVDICYFPHEAQMVLVEWAKKL